MHADSIDPKLEDCVIDNDGSEVAAAPVRAAAADGPAVGPVADGAPAATDCGMFAAAPPEATPPTPGTVAAAAAFAIRPSGGSGNTRDTAASDADGVGKEGGAGDPSGGGAAFGVGVVGIGSASGEGVLQSSSLATVGRIPSDPVLAMQMGARMALSGEFPLLGYEIGARRGRRVHCFDQIEGRLTPSQFHGPTRPALIGTPEPSLAPKGRHCTRSRSHAVFRRGAYRKAVEERSRES